jgi:alpha-L-rhamnosidase
MKLLIIVFCSLLSCSASAQLKEPYKPLHNGRYTGAVISASPDPLINYRWDKPSASDSLQIYFLKPKSVRATPRASFKQNNDQITILGRGDLFFDFGVESAGWLEFQSDDLVGDVDMSISEYNEPAIVNEGAQHPIKTSKAARYGNVYRLELNDGLYEGVRFGWIHIKQFSKPAHIRNVRLVCQVKPVNYQGSFSCNDATLNRIWYTGAYVVKQNMLQDYLGAILMERSDRHSWTGDAYPAQAAALAAFGNYDFIRKNIAFTSGQDNGIAAYSIYWVLSLIDYYNYTGDADFLKAYIDNASRRLDKAYQEYDNLPPLGFMGWDERLGAGFEHTQIQEAQNTYRMLCINGWKHFAEAMRSIHEPALAAKYQQYVESKTRLLQADKNISQYGIHAVAEAINAGLYAAPPIQQRSHIVFADRLNRLSYSPFNQYFIIQAMALAGEKRSALTTIKDNWGGQLAYGGTCFFEVYRPSWNAVLKTNDAPPNNQCGYTSLAHPWGAGVTSWLSENILGIRPVTPGFETFQIIPFLQDALTQVRGEMPTPHGPIAVSFDTESGDCEINIPPGTTAKKIGLPKNGKAITSITLNKKKFWQGNAGAANAVEEDSSYIYLKDLHPGRYVVKIKYGAANRSPRRAVEQFHYPLQTFVQDSLTGGRWKGKYGKDGYMLLGCCSENDSKKLPEYICGITSRLNGVVVWDSLSTDSRVLENGRSNKKVAAAIVTRDPLATLQTMTIDIANCGDEPYELSLYFLDWDKNGRRSAIEIFELETLNIIAPMQMIRQYEKGKYLSFTVNKSIRIRINQVRGENAAVSGLFFDRPKVN